MRPLKYPYVPLLKNGAAFAALIYGNWRSFVDSTARRNSAEAVLLIRHIRFTQQVHTFM